jgi:hypothetical protein
MPRRPPPRAAVRVVFAGQRILRWIGDHAVPAHLAVFDRTAGLWRAHVVGALAEVGVPDALAEGPATAAALAGRLDADADALHRLMRAGASEGLLKLRRDGTFRLTRVGAALRSDAPRSVAPWARYLTLPSTTAAWAQLPHGVRTGESPFRSLHGTTVWDWFAAHPEEERLFAAAMRGLTEEFAPIVAAGYPWPETGVVCDVAGGVGTLLAAILETRPGLRGMLVDAPGVLAEAEGWLAARGLRERVELVEGDLFGDWSAAADVYVLKDVLHDWGDEACGRILAGVRRAAPAGSRVVLVESLQPRNRPDPLASLQDLQMLTQCDDGRQRSAEELAALLRAAGFAPGPVRHTGGPALVEGS